MAQRRFDAPERHSLTSRGVNRWDAAGFEMPRALDKGCDKRITARALLRQSLFSVEGRLYPRATIAGHWTVRVPWLVTTAKNVRVVLKLAANVEGDR